MGPRRILITGSSGFIGSHLVRRFRERGWQVMGIGRRPLNDPDYISHDLSQPLEPNRTTPCDVVIHTAARSNPWGTRREFHADNVEGTRNILNHCLATGLPKLVFISSSSVYYRPQHQLGIVEETPLATSLESNLQQSSVTARFWWLVDDDDALGREVVAKLQARYPDRIRVVACPPCPDGVNPKAFKLQRVVNEIETEYVAVLDDDTTLAPDHLNKAVAALAHCDLYTGLPCYDTGTKFWSSLLAHFVNNNSILTYLSLLNLMQPLTINGMFYVLKRETLLRWQGWEGILRELCDDYAFAQVARRNGARIQQGITAQHIHTTVDGPKLLQTALRLLPSFVDDLMQEAGVSRSELLVLPHQASPRAVDMVRRRLGFGVSQFVNRAAGMGNLASASIPVMIDQLRCEGHLERGQRLLFLGTSAGYAQAGMILSA